MIFARKIWTLLVAIKDGLALLFLLLFFLLLYAALSGRPTAAQIREGALLLRLDGTVVEEPATQDPLALLMAQEAPASQYAARDLVRALRLAAADTRIKAVALDLSRFAGGGYVNLRDVGAAMEQVRRAGKPVLVYGLAYTDDSLLLAAHASEVWIHPMGAAFALGPGGNQLYFADLLERLKVDAHVFKVGTYKSAVEPVTRNDMSEPSREQNRALAQALWANWKANVSRARPKANLALVTGDPVAWLRASGNDTARAALAAGLVDRIGDEAAFGERVAALAGKDEFDDAPGSFAHTTLATYLGGNARAKSGKAIGVVTVAGAIVDGDAGPGMAGGDRIAALLDEAFDDDLAALVVRVDSPGGSILASERIRMAIARYKAKKVPVVVSMSNVAASGGYWVSMPADRIFAEPGTITGSIGVFAVLPTFERALASIGIHADGVRTTPLSGQPDLAAGLTPEVEGLLQANVEGSYARFLSVVGKARGKTPQAVDRVAQGRVWDGGTARQLGLVDQFGTLDDALADAAKRAGLKPGGWHVKYLATPLPPWAELAAQLASPDSSEAARTGRERDWVATMAERQQHGLASALQSTRMLVSAQGVQAYCLECPGVPAPLSAQAKSGWLALLARGPGLLAP